MIETTNSNISGTSLACIAFLSSVLHPLIPLNASPTAQQVDNRPFYYRADNASTNINAQIGLTGDTVVDSYRPRTELGRKLIALRRAYVTAGGQLLDGNSLDAEIQLRRGTLRDV